MNLDDQITKLLDSSKGNDDLDLIVQVDTGVIDACQSMMQQVTQALRDRRLLTDPNEIVPRVGKGFCEIKDRTKPTKRQQRVFGDFKGSLSAQVSLALKHDARSTIFKITKNAFIQLEKHTSIRAAIERQAMVAPEQFPSSGAARVKMSRDELHTLRDAAILSVHDNRRLQVPPIRKLNKMPAAAQSSLASTWGVSASGALAAWGAYGARGQGVRVGVLDTGVDATHPSLAGKVATFAEFDASGAMTSSQPRDSHSHGTHVCGTVCGNNDSGQWIGMAPDAELAVGLVLDGEKGGSDAQILAGLDWALNTANVDVINLSLGGLDLSPFVRNTYEVAIVNCLLRGVPVVAAIGNDGYQTSGAPGSDLFAFAVGATDVQDEVAGFSGGRTQQLQESSVLPPQNLPITFSKPEISAPGVAVLSCIPDNQYAAYNGTSMATPHVAGAIALLLSATNKLTDVADDARGFLIQDLLSGSVKQLGEAGQDQRYGFGQLNILEAIAIAREQGY